LSFVKHYESRSGNVLKTWQGSYNNTP